MIDNSRTPIFVDEAEIAIHPADYDAFREELHYKLNIHATITTDDGQIYRALIMRKQG